MASIEPSGDLLGASLRGIDLAKPLGASDVAFVLDAIGRYGLVRFPQQEISSMDLLAFAGHFGPVQPILGRAAKYTEQGLPEISILSNIVIDGKNIGAVDVGTLWHTDMVYNETPGFLNVLYALKVPRRNGQPLGATQFIDTQAAYNDLADDIKGAVEGATGVYSGGEYAAADAETRTLKKVTRHPIVLIHPLSQWKGLYFDPMHISAIEDAGKIGSEEAIAILREHITQDKFRFTFRWSENDVMMWDNLRTLHVAVQDYGPNEHRLIKRCQVLGESVFNPVFVSDLRRTAACV